MRLLIATKELKTKTRHCQMHGDPYEVEHPHTLIKYKLNGERVKTLEMNGVARNNESVLMALLRRSKRLLHGSHSFVEWDEIK